MQSDLAFQTLAVAIVTGTFLTVLARKFGLPTIVLLFAGGLAFGPQGLGLIIPSSLDNVLPALVSIAIGIILFEGGLTLDPRDYLRSPVIIKRLLTIGAIITWVGSALAVKIGFGASWSMSLLAGSLVIVTGPTVIFPMLRRLRLKPKIASILHWEAVLIDAIGVFLAVFCYELVIVGDPVLAAFGFFGRFAVGAIIGVAGGLILQYVLHRSWIPESLTNPFVLAVAVGIFLLAEIWSHEAGLLAVTVAGIIIGRRRSIEVKQISTFKAELSDLLIGTLFLLLVSRLNLQAFLTDGPALIISLTIIMLLIRPLNIWISTLGSNLGKREKLFLSWIAPRGIVAASMASLFTLELNGDPRFAEEAALLEKFTYSVICATVVLQGLSAGWWARKLGISQPKATGWLLVGAHRLGREIAREISLQGVEVLVVDNNHRNVATAVEDGLEALTIDAREMEELMDDPRFENMGYFLAMTDNPDLNQWLASLWKPHFGKGKALAWLSEASKDTKIPFSDLPRPGVLSEELRLGLASVTIVPKAELGKGHALFIKLGNELLPADDQAGQPGTASCIALSRPGDHLQRALENGTVLDLACTDLHDLYRKLADVATTCEPRLAHAQLIHDLIAQEQVLPPFWGHGIAAPHVYSQTHTSRLCILAHLKPALTAPDVEEPITTVYFIISPTGDPEGHLATLADIARRCRETHPSFI